MFKWNYAINSQRRVLCKEKFFKIKISSTVFSAVHYELHTWMTSSAREFSILFFAHCTVSMLFWSVVTVHACALATALVIWLLKLFRFDHKDCTKFSQPWWSALRVFQVFPNIREEGKPLFAGETEKKYCMNWEKLYRATRSVSYTMHSTRSSAKD